MAQNWVKQIYPKYILTSHWETILGPKNDAILVGVITQGYDLTKSWFSSFILSIQDS
ncbi:hypothetical protein PL11201_260006 [Planktothrix sp. PCC 11201]|nr:hypothetical protein PL11201_260006 [Planktothrix sp. PCC 11201]